MKSIRRALAALMALTLVAGCGSSLSEEELVAANGAFREEAAGTATRTGNDTEGPALGTGGTGTEGSTPDVGGPTDGSGGAAVGGGGGGGDSSGTTGEVAEPSAPAASSQCPPDTGNQEIRLGTFGSEGGVIGANVATAPVGIRAWVADVNARGGLCGHPVRVIFGGNDSGDPAQAQAIARRLVEQDKVIGFLSPYSPTGMPSVYPILQQRGIPVIADASSGPEMDRFTVSFQPAASFAAHGYGFSAAFVDQTPLRKVAIVTLAEVASAAVSVQSIREFAAKSGYQIVYEASVSLASPDFTAQMTEARNRGAEVVIGVVDFTSMLKIIRSAARQGYKPQFSGSLAFVTDAIKSGAAEFEGVVAYSPTALYTSPPAKPYRDAVARYVPRGELGLLGPVAWAGGRVLEEIAPELVKDLSPAGLMRALYTLRDTDLGGLVPRFSFTPGGHPNVNRCVLPVRYVGGRWTAPKGDSAWSCIP